MRNLRRKLTALLLAFGLLASGLATAPVALAGHADNNRNCTGGSGDAPKYSFFGEFAYTSQGLYGKDGIRGYFVTPVNAFLQVCDNWATWMPHGFTLADVRLTGGGPDEIVQAGQMRIHHDDYWFDGNMPDGEVHWFYAWGGNSNGQHHSPVAVDIGRAEGANTISIKREYVNGAYRIRIYLGPSNNLLMIADLSTAGALGWVNGSSVEASAFAENSHPTYNIGGNNVTWMYITAVAVQDSPGGTWLNPGFSGSCYEDPYTGATWYNCQIYSSSSIRWSTDSP